MNFDRLKNFLDYELSGMGIPGSDTVIYLGRDVIFRHVTGFDSIKDRTPMHPDALYNMYSCTKVSTAIALTQLIERGEIIPHDPIYAYFPEFKNMYVKVTNENGDVIDVVPAKNPIQIQHLLTMTSGINIPITASSIEQFKQKTDGKCPTLAFPAAIAKEPLDFEPGTQWCYGLSLDVIGALIELVSEKKLSEYMKENIFEPLGMKNTTFGIPEDKRNLMATQYKYNPEIGIAEEIPFDYNPFVFGDEYESGGAGLVSCVDDQILLADAMTHLGLGKNGNRILSESAVKLMSTNQLSDDVLKTVYFPHLKGYGYGYGVRTNLTPEKNGNLAPAGEFGWDGAKMSYISCDPKNKISVFHAEHMGGLSAIVWPRLRNLIYSSLDY